MFERPTGQERAVLVHLKLGRDKGFDEASELKALVIAAGGCPVATVLGKRAHPDPKYFIGKGKVVEVQSLVAENSADFVVFDHEISPAQERNLERSLKCRVLDRTGLILDIFSQRARTFEGKLQVELAQLRHLSTRLVRGWTHLERQKGGIGLRGPGETQLETDRRLIGHRIKQIKSRLDKVVKQRTGQRRSRLKRDIKVVSLVGYTNAGKTSLFNKLTGSDSYVANQLFATLDPTLRRWWLPAQETVILTDTVGFIKQLPHELVAAFRATLEETQQANLILHIIDAHHAEYGAQIQQVNQVLEEIGANNIPHIMVFNKIDLLESRPSATIQGPDGTVQQVWLSVESGDGLELLAQAVICRLDLQS